MTDETLAGPRTRGVAAKHGQFEGRRVLVTGGGSGIGAATAHVLHERGAEVLVADIDHDAAGRVSAELGPGATALHLDVTSEVEWDRLESQLDHVGTLHNVVHSAGAALSATLAETSLDDFRRMVEVNLTSTFLAVRMAARCLADGGSVALLSSLRGVVATEGLGAYGAAKFGVRALARVAALELAPRGIRVNAVCPGSIETPITNGPGFQQVDMEAYVRSIPLLRRGGPGEVAAAIAFLLSDDAEYVTGTDFLIDGGTAAGRLVPTSPAV
ncbi:SDR family oxidoreductase [Nocardioides panacisoli]|uniref:SDR family NAD(P)-dependent oxidoreductase n=1 Tax=Nocardioides panacisoli TaxID=627624 RepID=UPI001C62AB61|nr:SDR family oxidoreductase [Nocardioides panacisoli]QYJ03594.1 SDR family oxidoreductase [Nocardioides panacisoli]